MNYQYRYQVKIAVTWRIITELFRRHHERCKLKVFELHPCSGQYDCLAIYSSFERFPGKSLCHFHHRGQHLHIFGTYNEPKLNLESLRWPDGNDYVAAFLSANNPVEIINGVEQVLGLPKHKGKLPPSTPAILCFRLISALVERYMLARECVDIRCGWYDSSGMEGSYIREELSLFPDVQRQLPDRSCEWEEQAKIASRFWLVIVESPGGKNELKALIDLRGLVYFVNRPDWSWDVWGEFKKNDRKLSEVVNRFEELLRK